MYIDDIQVKSNLLKWGTLNEIESIHVEGVVIGCNSKEIVLDDGIGKYTFQRSSIYEKNIHLNQYVLLGLELELIDFDTISFTQKLFIDLSNNQIKRKDMWVLEVLHARRFLYNMSLPLNVKIPIPTTTTTNNSNGNGKSLLSSKLSTPKFNLTTSDIFKKNEPIEFTDVFSNNNNSNNNSNNESLTSSEKDEMQTFDYDFSGTDQNSFNQHQIIDDDNEQEEQEEQEEEQDIPVYEEIDNGEQEEEEGNLKNTLNFDDEWDDQDFI